MTGISFRSSYFIPYKELNKNDVETVRQFAKYANSQKSVSQTSKGATIIVDDKRDKDFEKHLKKCGLSINKNNSDDKAFDRLY